MKKGSLGDRMKADYENRTRFFLPRRTYTLIRADGKNFHQGKRTGDRAAAEVERSVWECVVPPIFTQDREWLRNQVPRPETV